MTSSRKMSLITWFGRSFWSLLDQGLFAASNFLINVLLARWVGEAEYGAFSAAFAVFLLLGVGYTSLMVEPMLVYGSGRYEGAFHGYLRALGRVHWNPMACLTSAVGLLIALAYLGGSIAYPLAILALSSGVVFQQWLLRRACYIRLEPRVAAIGGMVYMIVTIGGLTALRWWGHVGVVEGILLMTVGSAASSWWIRKHLLETGEDSSAAPTGREVRMDHWTYGKWSLATGLIGWIPGNIYMLLLPVWHGPETAGAFRAAFNFALPMFQVQAAAATLLLPTFVRLRNKANYGRNVIRLVGSLLAPSAAYVCLCYLFGREIFVWLYAGAFEEQSDDLWVVVFPLIPAAATAVLAASLRALEVPRVVFVAYAIAVFVCALVGLPMAFSYGVNGVAIGISITSTITAIALAAQLGRTLRPSARLIG